MAEGAQVRIMGLEARVRQLEKQLAAAQATSKVLRQMLREARESERIFKDA